VKNIIPFRVRPILATLVSEPFDESGWVYEEKYDGIRILAHKEGSKVTLLSRNDKDRTGSFPGIVATIRSLPASKSTVSKETVVSNRFAG
jgi:bifunctional non-homologous end joining protein LigD